MNFGQFDPLLLLNESYLNYNLAWTELLRKSNRVLLRISITTLELNNQLLSQQKTRRIFMNFRHFDPLLLLNSLQKCRAYQSCKEWKVENTCLCLAASKRIFVQVIKWQSGHVIRRLDLASQILCLSAVVLRRPPLWHQCFYISKLRKKTKYCVLAKTDD